MLNATKTPNVCSNDEKITLWNKYYAGLKDNYLFPNEFVVRTFLGSYPKLAMEKHYQGAKICDISCGDGRNITALNKLGFTVYGTEVSDEICGITRKKLLAHPDKISADIRTGVNSCLPFEDNYFDYLLSWNACYYMENAQASIATHIAEFGRVLKKDGYLVACVPAPTCFSVQGAEKLGKNMIRIQTNSKWDLLNGSIYHLFHSFDEIEAEFSSQFKNFSFCKLQDDCFGLQLDYFIFVCQKR